MNNPPDSSAKCPFCSSLLHVVYVKTNGGIWFHESKDFMNDDFDNENVKPPIHCVVGNSGHTKGFGDWPKDGYFCEGCKSITIKPS